ncbi:MAG: IPT/TIG domain-containing protein [Treponema sp.]|nr:IPT/TIG domain-containing protein [Treponema sp.]
MANRKITIFLLALISLFVSCSNKTPVISSIDPKIGNMGEIITLTGSNFGESRDESYVSIAGTAPTSSSYYLWQDDLIIVRIPELGESGLIHVHAKGKKSNGVLFSNSASVPRPVDGDDMGLEPKIAAIIPQIGAPGTLINITGNNFGVTRENAGVFFSWDYDSGTVNPYMIREPEFIEVSEFEMGYEYWSARELRVRLPDGAVSGNLEIRTSHGSSRSIFFDVSGRPGNKNLKDKRIYTVTYTVDIKVLEATRPNTLYLWIPKPIASPSQRNVSLVSRSAEPFVENYKGVSLFKLDSLGSGANQSVNLSYRVEVYAVETGIRPLSLRQEKNALTAAHTQSSALILSDSQKIKSVVNSIARNEQNPYTKAKAIYDWIIANMHISNSPLSSDNIEDALEKRQSDPYTTALLYTAMTRAAGIPCIPVAGVYIDRNGQTFRHYWSEFWIDNFGWLPVDISMGSGAVFDTAQPKQETMNEKDIANFYFGNMDNQRIAFSRGELVLSQMENRGRLVSHPQSYSLQNIWEESAGGLESYSSLWGDITISGIYQ